MIRGNVAPSSPLPNFLTFNSAFGIKIQYPSNFLIDTRPREIPYELEHHLNIAKFTLPAIKGLISISIRIPHTASVVKVSLLQ
jgi:hypothetical protein